MKHYHIQLTSGYNGAAVIAAGGTCYVAVAGGARKVTLQNKDGSAKANPVALVNGAIDFYTADSVSKVDLYIQAPNGSGKVQKNVTPSGDSSLPIYSGGINSALVIPFSIFDTTANVETATGFVCPTKGAVLPMPSVDVLTVDAGMTIDVGTLSSDSGDADGFIDGVSLASAATLTKASVANGAITLGVLLWAQDSANAGDEAPEMNVSMSGKGITYTLSASSDTGEGFIRLPVQLGVGSLI